MDLRRNPRTVIDPMIRQVGFVTPGAPPPPRSNYVAVADDDFVAGVSSSSPPSVDLPISGGSLSPVMIPPPRHTSAPVPVPAPAPRNVSPLRRDDRRIVVGTYNPSETVLGTPPLMSPSSRIDATDAGSEFSDELSQVSWFRRGGGTSKVASSLPASRGEMMAMKDAAVSGCGNNPRSNVMTAAKNLPGISDQGALKMPKEGVGMPKEKPKMSKAERRAIQEAQRAAKAAAKEAGGGHKLSATSGNHTVSNAEQIKLVKPPKKKDGYQEKSSVGTSDKKVIERPAEKDRKKDVPQPRMQYDDVHRVEKAKRRAVVNQAETRNRVELFRHLPQYIHGTQLPDLESKFFHLDLVHPSVYKVGLQYLTGDITGGNACCIAMLLAFREAIKDYSTPRDKTLVRDLMAKISSYVSFLIECRPLSISMGNAIKFLKSRIAKLPHTLSESEAKSSLQSDIDRFINEKIVIADKVIVRHAVTKIRDGDVLLTYGSPSVVEMILVYAHDLGKKFRVIIVDSRPKLEGQTLLRR